VRLSYCSIHRVGERKRVKKSAVQEEMDTLKSNKKYELARRELCESGSPHSRGEKCESEKHSVSGG